MKTETRLNDDRTSRSWPAPITRPRHIYTMVGGRWLFIIAFVAMCGIYEYGRIFSMRPLPMHIWRQTDCLALTYNYYTGRATFASPEILAQIAGNGTSGKSAGEFPLIYWGMGQVWKITGQKELVYRLFGLMLHFIASLLFLQMLRKLLRSDFWSVTLSLLLFTSPILVYYSISFLTDVPALDMALIGWYFFHRHAGEGRIRYWVLSMAFFALGMLLKVSAGIGLVAIMVIYLAATLVPRAVGSFRHVFPKPLTGWGTILLVLAPVAAWYVHAEAYNDAWNGRYTFNSLWPIWEMNSEEIGLALGHAREILIYQIFDTTVWLVIGVAVVFLVINAREVPRAVLLLNVLLAGGAFLYTLLWFHAVDQHDYYFINPIISIIAPLITAIWWLGRTRPAVFHSPWLRWSFVLLLGYNAAYAANNITMRSNPGVRYDSRDLLPVYHRHEPAFWNEVATQSQQAYHGMDAWLDGLGVDRNELMISLDDGTINASLYFMGRRGFTRYAHDFFHDPGAIERCIALGGGHLVFVHDWWVETSHMRPYLEHPVGRYGNAHLYDLRPYRLPPR